VSEVTVDLREPDVIVRVMLTSYRAIDDFLGDCARRGYSQRTLTTYRRILDQFADRLPDDYDVAKITTDDCRRYLSSRSHLSRGTVAHTEAVLSSWLRWMYQERKIGRNPLDRLPRTRRVPAADLEVTTVSADDVRRLILHAASWAEKLTIGVLVYLGPRRRAVARLRLADYDRARGRIRFREKGAKTIWKPVPDELDQLLEAAIAAGVYADTDYLIPPEGPLSRRGDRDDRVIWRIVKRVADRAGIDAHVHALRAAFAVYYLEANPGDVEALKELMGHKSIATTQVYLRKLDRQTAMERVRPLSWGVALEGDKVAARNTEFPVNALASSPVMGAGGFEPP
jgi:site-specific recombinase XerD